MLGCFGQRKKKGGSNNSSSGKDASKSPIDRSKGEREAPALAPASAPAETKPKSEPQPSQKPVQQAQVQARTTPAAETAAADTANSKEVTETVTVARSHSLYQQAPSEVTKKQQPTVTVKKAATLGRYDFLKKYDNASNSDRWSSLKRQYLAPKDDSDGHEAGDATDSLVPSKPPARLLLSPLEAVPPPKPKSPLGPGIIRSLPRQFSPPSTVVSPVKFSNWFHERKTREEEARRECQDREEKMQKIIEGPTERQIQEAAVKIQAGFKGYKARRDLRERREKQSQTVAEAASGATELQDDSALVAGAPEPDRKLPEAAEAEPTSVQTSEVHSAEPDKLDDSRNSKSLTEEEEKRSEAALKIQAGFRGMQARREVASMRKQQDSGALATKETGDNAEPSADAAAAAATKE